MSLISIETAKKYLNVIHDADDETLQLLLDGAEDEAADFIDRPLIELLPEPSSEETSETVNSLPAGVTAGVLLLLQASYQSSPADAEKLRKNAETKLTPYRIGWGC